MITWLGGVVASVLLIAVIIVFIMVINAFRNRIITEEIILKSLPDEFNGFRILFITDIHRRRLPAALLTPLIGEIDAVFIGGDLTEKNNPLGRLSDNLNLVMSIAPTYVVHGNHDYRANIALVDQTILRSGAKLLMDENLCFKRGGSSLWLTGVDFSRTGANTQSRSLPPLRTEYASSDICRIVLVHDPLWLSKCKIMPADLILAGHTHGGQVILPFLGRRHVESFYHKYDAGMFKWPREDGTGEKAQLLISRGFGTAHLPLRLGSPAEMHVLTLRKEQLN